MSLRQMVFIFFEIVFLAQAQYVDQSKASFRYLKQNTCIDFDNNGDLNCSSCVDKCVTCKPDSTAFSTLCTSCSKGYIPTDDQYQCVTCKDDGYYQANGVCKKCHSECKNCKGPDQNQCNQCFDGFYLDLKNTHKCLSCYTNCKTCQGPNSNECDQCQTNFYQIKNPSGKLSECTDCQQNGFYISQQNCLPCDASCKACQKSSSNCQGCQKGYYQKQQNENCQKCHENCATCDRLETVCTSCNQDKYLDQSQNTCVSCDSSCNGCIGPKNSDCSKCKDGYSLVNSICIKCHSSCKTCSGTNSTQCESCNSNLYLTKDHTCIDCQQPGFFIQGLQCLECNKSCLTCKDNPNNCLTCEDGSFLQPDGTCAECQTNNGYYIKDIYCYKCDDSCLTCSENSTKCLSCQKDLFLTKNNQCVQCDQVRQYQIKQSQKCEDCDPSCLKCNGTQKNNCTQCDQNLFLSQNYECLACDQNGQQKVGTKCIQCDQSCLTCDETQNNICKTCRPGEYLTFNKSCKICNQDGWFIANQNECLQCDPTCKKCNGTLNSTCLTCYQGYFLNEDNQCVLCNNEGYFISESKCLKCNSSCLTCNSIEKSNCKTCAQGLYLTKDNQCVKCDQERQFQSNNQICENCDSSCLRCIGTKKNNCTQCEPTLFLSSQNECVACDQIGQSTLGNQCIQCHPSCRACNGTKDSDCLSCNNAKYLTPKNQCTSCNEDGYFISPQNICLQCDITCLKCNGATSKNCTSCPLGKFLFKNNSCISCDSNGLFIRGNQCLQCDSSCLTCKGAEISDCLSCPKGKYLLASSNTCTNTCNTKNGYFIQGEKCIECNKDCRTCNGKLETNCLSCSFGLVYQPTFSKCNKCEEGLFLNKSNNQCEYCHKDCLICTGPNKNECKICRIGLIISKVTNTCEDSTKVQNELDELEFYSKVGCLELQNKVDQNCLQRFETSQSQNSILNILSISNLVLMIISSLFTPFGNSLGQINLQNSQTLGNYIFASKLNPLWMNQLELKTYYAYHIVTFIPNTINVESGTTIYSFNSFNTLIPINQFNDSYFDNCFLSILTLGVIIILALYWSVKIGFKYYSISSNELENIESLTQKVEVSDNLSRVFCIFFEWKKVIITVIQPIFIFTDDKQHLSCWIISGLNVIFITYMLIKLPFIVKQFNFIVILLETIQTLQITLLGVILASENNQNPQNISSLSQNMQSIFRYLSIGLFGGLILLQLFMIIQKLFYYIYQLLQLNKRRINNNSSIQQIDDECKSCEEYSDCSQYQTGYYFFKNQTACTICDIQNGYYISRQSYLPCTQNCQKCNSLVQCTTCLDGFYLQEKQCKNCSQNCQECLSENVCDTCQTGFYFQQNQSGQFTNDKKCQKCDSTCLTCHGATKMTFFLAKKKNTYLKIINVFHVMIVDNSLEDKNAKNVILFVLIAMEQQNDFLQCQKEKYLSEDNQCIPCNESGQFINREKCQKCDSTCLICQGTTKNDGLSCPEQNYLTQDNSTCISNCNIKNGYFISADKCIECDQNCRICNGQSETNCLSCKLGFVLQPTLGKCDKCEEGQFLNEVTGECEDCQKKLFRCSGPRENQCIISCLDLQKDLNCNQRFETTQSQTKILDILSIFNAILTIISSIFSYFGAIFGQIFVQNLQLTGNYIFSSRVNSLWMNQFEFKTNYAHHIFTIIQNIFKKSNAKSQYQFNFFTYLITVNDFEDNFQDNCLLSILFLGILIVTAIIIFLALKYLYFSKNKLDSQTSIILASNDTQNYQNVSELPQMMHSIFRYANMGLQIVSVLCQLFCILQKLYQYIQYSWSNQKIKEKKQNITVVEQINISDISQIINKCVKCNQDGEYIEILYKLSCCFCKENCKSCTNYDNCSQCKPGFYFFEDTSDCQTCNINFKQFIATNQKCRNCNYSCQTCNGVTEFNCLSCIQGYYLQNDGQCKICDQNCLNCSSKNICDTCQAGFYFKQNQTLCTSCDTQNGYYTQEKYCLPCPQNCQKCSSLNQCTACFDGFYFQENSNFCITCNTDDGYFISMNQCLPCDKNCQKCSTQDICTECKSGYYFLEKNTCKPCYQNCSGCQGPKETDCTACLKNFVFLPSLNKCDLCEEGSFFNKSTKACDDCDEMCLTCIGKNKNECTYCRGGLVISNTTNTCEQTTQVQNELKQLEFSQQIGCYDEQQQQINVNCLNQFNISQEQTQILDILAIITICLTFVSSIFSPIGSTLGWIFIQNQQIIGNYIFSNKLSSLWMSQLELKMNYAHNLFTLVPNIFTLQNNNQVQIYQFNQYNSLFTINDFWNSYFNNCFLNILLTGIKQFYTLDLICLATFGGFYAILNLYWNIKIGCKYYTIAYENIAQFQSLVQSVEVSTTCKRIFWLLFEWKKVVISAVQAFFMFKQEKIQISFWIHIGLNCIFIVYIIAQRPFLGRQANFIIIIQEILHLLMISFLCIIVFQDNQPNSDKLSDFTKMMRIGFRYTSYGYLGILIFAQTLLLILECIKCDQPGTTIIGETFCIQCPQNCAICDINYNCSSCLTNFYFLENQGICVKCDLNNGYYLNKQNICKKCDYSCQTCKAQSQNNCTSCMEGLQLQTDGSCKKPCNTNNGFFYDLSMICQQCDQSCKTCSSKNSCIICQQDLYQKENQNQYQKQNKKKHLIIKISGSLCQICETDKGYFIKEKYCLPCSQNCLNCSSESVCNKCSGGYYLIENSTTCQVCNQNNGYFIQQDQCLPCGQNCQNCKSQSDCQICKQGFYLIGSSTICKQCDLNNGYFVIRGQCLSCSLNCLTCSSQNICQKCKSGYYMIGNSKTCTTCDFDTGYFLQDEQCLNCGQNCLSCSSEKVCTKCQNGYYLIGNSTKCKLCETDNGYFVKDDQCLPCGQNCLSCSSNSVCKKCQSSYYLIGNSKVCNECNLKNGFFVKGDQCLSCSQNCLSCSSENVCTQCQNGYYLIGDSTTCKLCETDNGYFVKDDQCLPCGKNCLSCSSNSVCKKCQSSYYLIGNSKVCDECNLKNGFFIKGDQCLSCSQNCLSCSSQDVCIQCQNGYFLIGNSTICSVCNKDNGYFMLSDQCLPCNKGCLTCTSQNVCTNCQEGFYLKEKQCKKCDIENGYFITDNNCLPCDKNCSTCSGNSQNCTSCQKGLFIYDNKCIDCIIQQGYYISGKYCLTCDKSCSKCNGSGTSNCFACSKGYYFEKIQQNVNEVGSCKPCFQHCSNCKGPQETDCISCSKNLVMLPTLGKCGLCEEGQFFNEQIKQCDYCDEACLTCSGKNKNQCTNCRGGLIISNITNICELSSSIQSQQSQLEFSQKIGCFNQQTQKTDFDCLKQFDDSKSQAKIIDILAITSISLTIASSIFNPIGSTLGWILIQNQQLIGNYIFSNKLSSLWMSQLDLKASYAHNLFTLIPN
ncbi:hypothetical protein ABPG72_003123, partial [Tetrahymena utriculariae]